VFVPCCLLIFEGERVCVSLLCLISSFEFYQRKIRCALLFDVCTSVLSMPVNIFGIETQQWNMLILSSTGNTRISSFLFIVFVVVVFKYGRLHHCRRVNYFSYLLSSIQYFFFCLSCCELFFVYANTNTFCLFFCLFKENVVINYLSCLEYNG